MDFAICPLNGNKCPGEDQCYPAVAKANMINEAIDAGVEEVAEPVCPIIETLDGVARMSHAVAPLVELMLGNDYDPPSDEDVRKTIIEDLHLDQDGEQ